MYSDVAQIIFTTMQTAKMLHFCLFVAILPVFFAISFSKVSARNVDMTSSSLKGSVVLAKQQINSEFISKGTLAGSINYARTQKQEQVLGISDFRESEATSTTLIGSIVLAKTMPDDSRISNPEVLGTATRMIDSAYGGEADSLAGSIQFAKSTKVFDVTSLKGSIEFAMARP